MNLDFTERQAEREQIMTMRDGPEHLDRILTMSGEQLLEANRRTGVLSFFMIEKILFV